MNARCRTLLLVISLWLGLTTLPAASAITDNGNNTISDTETGLMWDKCPYSLTSNDCVNDDAGQYTWSEALTHVVAANTANHRGYNDWRLPNVKELESLAKLDSLDPALDAAFSYVRTEMWTNTLIEEYGVQVAMVVDFLTGPVYATGLHMPTKMLMVRNGGTIASFDRFGLPDAPTIGTVTAGNQTLQVEFTPPGNNGAPAISGYIASCTPVGGGASVTANGTGSPLTLTGLVNGTAYSCTVSAINATGTGPASSPTVGSPGAPQAQTLTFNALPDNTLGAADFTVSATASSGLTVSFASLTATQCTLTDHGNGTATVHLAARGTCTIRASQAGNATYSPAANVERSFFVHQNVGLNDTGQTFCYNAAGVTVTCSSSAYPRQDARYGRDAASPNKVGAGVAGFDYTALDANGNPTAPTSGATPHPCVRDNVTGLVWEVKTDDGGLHDKDWTYSWYSSDSTTNGGNAGLASGGNCGTTVAAGCDTEKFVAAVNASGWCGYSDWRLPTRTELVGLMDFEKVSPSIDTYHFPNSEPHIPSQFWSASTLGQLPAYVLVVSFSLPVQLGPLKTNSNAVRLVRGGQ